MTTVLIVDGHPALRLVLRQQFAHMLGIAHIVEAGNGQDAILMARQFMPGLVILDIDLPKLTGLEAIPRIKAIQPHARILVVSAHEPTVFAARAQAAGAHGYISKAQEVSDIARAIEAVRRGCTVFPDTGAAQAAADGAPAAQRLSRLSNKEVTVMQLLVRGMSNKEVGHAMFISNKTVSTYKTRLMAKLGVASLVELVDFARKYHIAQ